MKRIMVVLTMFTISGCAAGSIITPDMDSVAVQKQESWRAWLWARANTTVGKTAEDKRECSNRSGGTEEFYRKWGRTGEKFGGYGLIGNAQWTSAMGQDSACMTEKGYNKGNHLGY